MEFCNPDLVHVPGVRVAMLLHKRPRCWWFYFVFGFVFLIKNSKSRGVRTRNVTDGAHTVHASSYQLFVISSFEKKTNTRAHMHSGALLDCAHSFCQIRRAAANLSALVSTVLHFQCGKLIEIQDKHTEGLCMVCALMQMRATATQRTCNFSSNL
jgi:hypothetical protein